MPDHSPEGLIRIPDDQLYIMTLLTPLIEDRRSISINESLTVDNYLTGIRMTHHPGETVFKPAYARFECPRVSWHDHSINNLMVQGASLKLALNRARRGERPIVQLSVIERSGSHLRPTEKRYMLSGTASSSSVAERSTVNRMVVGL